MSRWSSVLIGLGYLPLLAACASTARVTGDFGEYRSYRQTRVATTLEAKLGASERYLNEYPKGDYANEVRRWFVPAEKRYFKLSQDNLPRLRAYLDALPRGPHAAAATERIAELESRRVFADRREQRLLDRAQGFEQRLSEAAEQRRAFLREFVLLTRLLGATRSFGQPTSELDSELLLRFRVRQPPGHCEGDHCVKVLPFAYAVPEDKSLTTRNVDLALEITLDRGLVQQLSLSAPELLTRVAEASRVTAIPSDNPQARAEALGQALDIVSDALDSPLPVGSCAAEAVSPVVLARRCNGLRLEVVAGTEAGALDRLLVRAERR
ncbi:MAG: hypothetical protein ABW061_24265 [Polyangiaceae bacterium]